MKNEQQSLKDRTENYMKECTELKIKEEKFNQKIQDAKIECEKMIDDMTGIKDSEIKDIQKELEEKTNELEEKTMLIDKLN